MITQTIKLNLIPGGILPRIKASQYDAGGRTLVFKLYNGVQEFTIPANSTVSIRGTKSDHTGFQYECEYSGSEVTAKITDQMTVSPGEVLAELVITKDDERIATGNFIFDNEEAALKDDVIISKTDIPAIERLDDLVDLVEEDTARAEAAKTAAETAALQASQSAQAAATSASQASTSATNAASSASAAASSESNAATSETNAGVSATQAVNSAAAALASQQAAAQSEANAAASESNAATSETNAGNSATAASASATAAAESEANAANSETAAAGSAASAATSATNAASSEANAAASESNAAASESNASASETAAAGSATSAATSATNAATSETNASNSETLARKWAVGDSGSGSNVPSDTNNAYYWAQVAQRAAGGGLTIEVVAALPTTDISVTKIYLVPSSDPKSQNVKDEYINLDGTTSGWELIGSTAIDLSGYYTKAQIDAIVQDVKDYADSKVAEMKGYVQENYTPTTMLKDTVGWTGKNLLPYPYQKVTSSNGVTWTDNGDGTITADGTATANSWVTLAGTTSNPAEIPNSIKKIIGQEVILSSGEETNDVGIRIDFFDSNKERLIDKNTGTPKYAKFVIPSNSEYIALQCFVYSGQTVNNLTFYPMLRRADIADDTYEPYHESVEEVVESKLDEDYANVYGAKNLIPYPYTRMSTTVRGITWSDNGDGGIVANGTGTEANMQPYCELNGNQSNNDKSLLLKAGVWYVLTCVRTSEYAIGANIYFLDPTTMAQTSYTFDVIWGENDPIKRTANNVYMLYNNVVYDEVKFRLPEDVYAQVQVRYRKGTDVTVANDVQYPMLRLASIKDDTWVPYAKTNKQLTEETAEIKDKIATVKASYDEDTALYAHAVGDIIYLNEHFYKVTAAIAVGDMIATGTNISADIGLAVDTPIYVSNLPND